MSCPNIRRAGHDLQRFAHPQGLRFLRKWPSFRRGQRLPQTSLRFHEGLSIDSREFGDPGWSRSGGFRRQVGDALCILLAGRDRPGEFWPSFSSSPAALQGALNDILVAGLGLIQTVDLLALAACLRPLVRPAFPWLCSSFVTGLRMTKHESQPSCSPPVGFRLRQAFGRVPRYRVPDPEGEPSMVVHRSSW